MSNSSKKQLGEILIEAGLVSIYQIELALQEQRQERNNLKLGEILVGCNSFQVKFFNGVIEFSGDCFRL